MPIVPDETNSMKDSCEKALAEVASFQTNHMGGPLNVEAWDRLIRIRNRLYELQQKSLKKEKVDEALELLMQSFKDRAKQILLEEMQVSELATQAGGIMDEIGTVYEELHTACENQQRYSQREADFTGLEQRTATLGEPLARLQQLLEREATLEEHMGKIEDQLRQMIRELRAQLG